MSRRSLRRTGHPQYGLRGFVIIGELRRFQTVGLVLLLVLLSLPAVRPAKVAVRPAASSTGWTTYHKDNTRNGFDASAAAFPAGGSPTVQWTSPALDGTLYAEPLALNGRVYAATENNSIYALDETTGGQVWAAHIASSVSDPASAVGCGNINPVGITSTPVIDPAAQIIYAVGLVTSSGSVDKYQLFARHLSDGSNVTGFPIDVSTASVIDPVYDEQRAAIGLAPNGNMVYVAFGGWIGDCNAAGKGYHPIVIAIPVGANLGLGQNVYQPQTGGQQQHRQWPARIAGQHYRRRRHNCGLPPGRNDSSPGFSQRQRL